MSSDISLKSCDITPLFAVVTNYRREINPGPKAYSLAKIVDLMLNTKGVDLNTQDNRGRTVVHLAIDSPLDYLLNILIKKPEIDLNIEDNEGNTPFKMLMSNYEKPHFRYPDHPLSSYPPERPPISKIALLLDKKNLLNTQNECGQTLLHLALIKQDMHLFNLLLKIDEVDVNIQDIEGRTALHYVVDSDSYDSKLHIVRALLNKKGVNPNLPDKTGRRILDFAIEEAGKYRHDDILNQLLGLRGYKDDLLRCLLQHKDIDVNYFDRHGRPPLFTAFFEKNLNVFRYLALQKGLNLNWNGLSILEIAFANNRKKEIGLLLSNEDFDLNLRINFGSTPLLIAFENSSAKIIYFLIRKQRIDLNAVNNEGKSAFFFVLKNLSKNGFAGINQNLNPLDSVSADILLSLQHLLERLLQIGSTPIDDQYKLSPEDSFYIFTTLLIKGGTHIDDRYKKELLPILFNLYSHTGIYRTELKPVILENLQYIYRSSKGFQAVLKKINEYKDPEIKKNIETILINAIQNKKDERPLLFVENEIKREESIVFKSRLNEKNHPAIQSLKNERKAVGDAAKRRKDSLTKLIRPLKSKTEPTDDDKAELTRLETEIKEIEVSVKAAKKEINDRITPLRENIKTANRLKTEADKISLTNPDKANEMLQEAKELLEVESHLKHRTAICAFLIGTISEGVPDKDVNSAIQSLGDRINLGDAYKLRTVVSTISALEAINNTYLTNDNKITILKKMTAHLGGKVGITDDENEIIAGMRLLQTLIKLGETDKLAGLLSTSDAIPYLKNMFDDFISSKFKLEGVENIADKFQATFGMFRNPEAILIYYATLRNLRNQDPLKLLSTFIGDVLTGQFLTERYNLEKSPHLKKIFEREEGAQLLEKWKKSESLPVEGLIARSKVATSSKIDYFDFFKIKICMDRHHLRPDSSEDYSFLENALNNPSDIEMSLEKLRTDIKALKQVPPKEALTEKLALLKAQRNILVLCQNKKITKSKKLKALESIKEAFKNAELENDMKVHIRTLSENQNKHSNNLNYTICDTDDPCDILLMGQEIEGSCQRLDGNPGLNSGLLGPLLDGKYRVVAVKDENGKMVARCLLKILWDSAANKPVLFQERMYAFNEPYNTGYHAGLLEEMCKRKARDMGLSLLRSRDYTAGIMRYPNSIASLGGRSHVEYVDAANHGICGNQYVIPTEHLTQVPL
jgi:ankyrin repeat protein